MKKIHFILWLSFIFICVTFFSACIKEHVTGVTLNSNELILSPGDTSTLKVTVSPDDATNKKVIWKSSNPTVATVNSSGLVKAIKYGETIITVTTKDGNYTAKCNIIVKESEFIVVSFDPGLVISTEKLKDFNEYYSQLNFDINQDLIDDIMIKAVNQSLDINTYLFFYSLTEDCFVSSGNHDKMSYGDVIDDDFSWIGCTDGRDLLFPYPEGEQFFALKFIKDDGIHYGWVLVNIKSRESGSWNVVKPPYYIIEKHAYCKTPNKVIFAGQIR